MSNGFVKSILSHEEVDKKEEKLSIHGAFFQFEEIFKICHIPCHILACKGEGGWDNELLGGTSIL